jgi:hypothetical protein
MSTQQNPVMLASVPMEVPSATDLMEEMRLNERPYVLYRYGEDWYTMEIGGILYRFPPVAPGKSVPHPEQITVDENTGQAFHVMVPADGICKVLSRYGMNYSRRADPKTGLPAKLGFGPIVNEKGQTDQTAVDLVKIALMNHAEYGVVWLNGRNDEARKEASKKIYLKSIRQWAEQEESVRQAYVANFRANPTNRGRTVPPPSPSQRKAIDILDEIRGGQRTGAEYICPFGCSEWDDWDKYARHMKNTHGKNELPPQARDGLGTAHAAPINYGETPTDPEDEPPADPPAEPVGRPLRPIANKRR